MMAAPDFMMVPLSALLYMPFKSREHPDEDLDDLVESIRQVGVLQPILVRPKGDAFVEIVAGERRAQAATRAGLVEIPAIVLPLSDQQAMEIQFVENIHRRDLTDYEKARWLKKMIKRYGYTQQDLAKKVGKSEAWISQHLRILDLEKAPEFTRVNLKDLTEFQARALLSVSPENRADLAQKIAAEPEIPSARRIQDLARGQESEWTPGPHGVIDDRKIQPEPDISDRGTSTKPASEAREEEIDQAVFTCKTCGQSFLIVHCEPSGRHRLKPNVRVV